MQSLEITLDYINEQKVNRKLKIVTVIDKIRIIQ